MLTMSTRGARTGALRPEVVTDAVVERQAAAAALVGAPQTLVIRR